jgi:hypothetical protein
MAIKTKPAVGRVLLLHAKPYKGCMVYIFEVDTDLFFYSVIFNNQMYHFHLEVTHPKDSKLEEKTIGGAIGMVLAGAHATIDTLTKTADLKEQGLAQTVIDAGEAAWYGKKKKGAVVN